MYRPVARVFRRGVTWVCYVYMYLCMHGYRDLGACSPRKFVEIRCSEISNSEAILGQKQSHSSYMARRVLGIHICIC